MKILFRLRLSAFQSLVRLGTEPEVDGVSVLLNQVFKILFPVDYDGTNEEDGRRRRFHGNGLFIAIPKDNIKRF